MRIVATVRHALRTLLAGRLFTAVALVCLTLGIATNTTMFSVFDAIFSICPRPMELRDAMSKTRERMAATAEQVGKLWAAARNAGKASG